MMRRWVIFLCCLLSITSLIGQITPPGLGDTKTSSWYALALRQSLDSANHIQSVTYIGTGRISGPSDDNPWKKPGIIIFNQEFYNQFRKHWQYSLAISYRRQNEYIKTEPYSAFDPPFRQEFRVYGRFSNLWTRNKLRLTTTFRQEYRRFYTPVFEEWSESQQLRSRFRMQASIDLDSSRRHRLLMAAEALFAMHKKSAPGSDWNKLTYSESRFAFYYSHNPFHSPFIFNIGYMYNLVGKGEKLVDGHYFAFDITWMNPFGKPGHAKPVHSGKSKTSPTIGNGAE